ncbi:TetR/AcrR family transcriptional regulator [Catenovulum sp. 2E275]|uniref:TetR/AcrR family transcriptional regulator n=1 Tax=Catenovulum sp. 2E275 TaxID=2980497 RepID=UPI0021D1C4DE|nr:TetR/AcrR family transcriptional regulator [Catenovulum sp. 2E275]MCU4676641.1 TetR/AcrR family transcriptional regulator [Catenovulum sp. 2E275]
MARNKNYNRADVIEQLTQVFIEKGYESTSMADLMDKTGLNKKSLYNEFGNKEAMFETILTNFIAGQRASIQTIFTQQPLGITNIRNFFSYLDTSFADKGCLLTLSLNESACISGQSLEMINQSMKGLEAGLLDNLSPLLKTDRAKSFARSLLTIMLGIATLTRSAELRANNLQAVNDLLDFIEASAKAD